MQAQGTSVSVQIMGLNFPERGWRPWDLIGSLIHFGWLWKCYSSNFIIRYFTDVDSWVLDGVRSRTEMPLKKVQLINPTSCRQSSG